MRYMKWFGVAAALLLIISCFIPWVFVESKNLHISGVDASGTNFGKPGYLHFIFAAFFFFFHLLPRLWAKRVNLSVVALNLAWAIRNFFVISACQAGECPEKKAGLILSLAASLCIFIAALFPDLKKEIRPAAATGSPQ